MLSNLLNLLQVPGSQENEYVMKGNAFNTISETICQILEFGKFFGDVMMPVWLFVCIVPEVSNRWKSMIGKPIDQSISINKISELVSIGIGQSKINR